MFNNDAYTCNKCKRPNYNFVYYYNYNEYQTKSKRQNSGNILSTITVTFTT